MSKKAAYSLHPSVAEAIRARADDYNPLWKAAPELLAALSEVSDWFEKSMEDADPGTWQMVLKRARAAIAKAEGK